MMHRVKISRALADKFVDLVLDLRIGLNFAMVAWINNKHVIQVLQYTRNMFMYIRFHVYVYTLASAICIA